VLLGSEVIDQFSSQRRNAVGARHLEHLFGREP
jgi:hypothetical protein